jgi:transposase-like protein
VAKCPYQRDVSSLTERTGILAQRHGVSIETIRKWRRRSRRHADRRSTPISHKPAYAADYLSQKRPAKS